MNRRFPFLLIALCILWGGTALAQTTDGNNPECLGNSCGAPQEEGGGCGCGCGCSVWVSYTDDGKTLSYTDDADGDGVADGNDNCPFATNRDQADSDGDGVGDSCDNCPAVANRDQLDTNGDGQGDACDDDIDGDGIANADDNCPAISNQSQTDTDGDWVKGTPNQPNTGGDACDNDDDNDGVPDAQDSCPTDATQGVVCKKDSDGDDVDDSYDNCPNVANPDQKDTDADGIGDACDNDIDNDGVLNAKDNCATVVNVDQHDDDGDGKGDACDSLYCVVVDASQPDDCLDPQAPFKVSAGGSMTASTGEKIRLPLFANRNGAAIKYVWTVTKRPSGSNAAVVSPEGSVTMSRHWQYAYVDNEVPTFTPDADGTYQVQLTATLAFPDRAYPSVTSSSAVLQLTVGQGENGTLSCEASPFDAGVAGGLLALLGMFLVERRRRRS